MAAGLHNHLQDMGPLLLEGVSSHHGHPTRKTAEQARHQRALSQDLYKLAVEKAPVVTAHPTVEGKFSALNQPLVGGYCFDIDRDFYLDLRGQSPKRAPHSVARRQAPVIAAAARLYFQFPASATAPRCGSYHRPSLGPHRFFF
jgi:hypothetical protein